MKVKLAASTLLLLLASVACALSDECAREIAKVFIVSLFLLWLGTIFLGWLFAGLVMSWVEQMLDKYFRGERR